MSIKLSIIRDFEMFQINDITELYKNHASMLAFLFGYGLQVVQLPFSILCLSTTSSTFYAILAKNARVVPGGYLLHHFLLLDVLLLALVPHDLTLQPLPTNATSPLQTGHIERLYGGRLCPSQPPGRIYGSLHKCQI